MSLLTIIQDAAEDLGISSPTSVVGSTDNQVTQLLALANREGKILASRYDWQVMIRENLFTMVATQSQGLLNSAIVTDGDFDYLIPETTWNRTTDLPVVGPQNADDWQVLQSFSTSGPFQRFRIQEGKFLMDPVPTAGDQLAFEYKSTSWCEDSGGTGQAKWLADTDVGRLNEYIMTLGVIWRWRHRKGLAYAEDMAQYEGLVEDAINRDKSGKTLNLNQQPDSRYPGVIVPSGTWNL